MDTKTTLTITAVHIGMVKPKRSSSDDDTATARVGSARVDSARVDHS